MKFFILFLMLLGCQTTAPKRAFLPPFEAAAISAPTCLEALKDYELYRGYTLVDAGPLDDNRGYWLDYKPKTGNSVAELFFLSPDYIAGKEEIFDNARYLGYCKHLEKRRYFLILEKITDLRIGV